MKLITTLNILICLIVGFGVNSLLASTQVPAKNQLKAVELPLKSKISLNEPITVSRNFTSATIEKSYMNDLRCDIKCELHESNADLTGFTKVVSDLMANEAHFYKNRGNQNFILALKSGLKLIVTMDPIDAYDCPMENDFTVESFEKACNINVQMNEQLRVIDVKR